MNIFVDPALVSEVLLEDGWHVVVPGTLSMGKYALVEPNTPSPAAPGFTFHEKGGVSIAGPVSSILAVRRALATRTTQVTETQPARPEAKPEAKPEAAPTSPAAASLPRDWWEP
jgi:hypothetical protein